jgi:hypothetical protein
MATTPSFVSTANIGIARPTAANTASDGSGTVGTDIYNLVTAAAGGTRVDRISIRNSQLTAAASAALVVRIFLTDTAGANPRLIEEVAVAAATRTVSAVGAAAAVYFPGGLLMKSGQILRCCVSVFAAASQTDIVAYGGDL